MPRFIVTEVVTYQVIATDAAEAEEVIAQGEWGDHDGLIGVERSVKLVSDQRTGLTQQDEE